jgi:hypothetical protein
MVGEAKGVQRRHVDAIGGGGRTTERMMLVMMVASSGSSLNIIMRA